MYGFARIESVREDPSRDLCKTASQVSPRVVSRIERGERREAWM